LLGGSLAASLTTSTNLTDHPENFILTALPVKYDKLYFRVNNTLDKDKVKMDATPGHSASTSDVDIAISGYYTKRKVVSGVASYVWEPIRLEDSTFNFHTSGLIQWDIPQDWARVIGDDLTWDVMSADSSTSEDSFTTSWNKDGYGILLACTVKNNTTHGSRKINITNIWPIIDESVELITIDDPHHVSLNDIAIAQSISYTRKGKYMIVEDRLGKSDIRRIGASGGMISFGGIDLGSDASGRDLMVTYQKLGTPVFLDVEHKDGDKTRFFGKITSMSEDFATGKMMPKWAVQMQVGYIIEHTSAGVMTSEKISLGGEYLNEPKYLL